MLTLTTTTNQLMTLNRDDAWKLELKLNVSSKGHPWASLGTTLFEFHSSGTPATLEITNEQFIFLELLATKPDWESCKGL
jgi:hypothetical protein